MSVKCIDLIIRQHTGANASDTVKITHAEVIAMIHCAGELSNISIGDRAELMAALEMLVAMRSIRIFSPHRKIRPLSRKP